MPIDHYFILFEYDRMLFWDTYLERYCVRLTLGFIGGGAIEPTPLEIFVRKVIAKAPHKLDH